MTIFKHGSPESGGFSADCLGRVVAAGRLLIRARIELPSRQAPALRHHLATSAEVSHRWT